MSDDPETLFTVGSIGGVAVGVLSIPNEPDDWPGELTNAEIEVARGLFQGKSYRCIASARGTSRSTVASQARSIFEKLDVDSASELVALLASE